MSDAWLTDWRDGRDAPVTFRPVADGLAAVDAVEHRRLVVETPESVDPRPADADEFAVPVDRAVTVSIAGFRLPTSCTTFVRDASWQVLAASAPGAVRRVPAGRRIVEVAGPVKLYALVDGPVTLAAGDGTLTVDFGAERRVLFGARSHHTRPAGTVTTTADPADVMAAVSTFGSALKTTSPECSFPTLRGHPPLVELGDDLDVPDHLTPPDTGVRLVVPSDRRHVYAAAPLAAYLGATVEPGRPPRLAAAGVAHPLPAAADEFGDGVGRLLRKLFLLDCVVRTEGLYPLELAERAALADRLPFDPADAYDLAVADRLATYLELPWEAVADQVPAWPLVAHVSPRPGTVELLPFLARDLALIRPAREGDVSTPSVTGRRGWDGLPSGDARAVPDVPAAVQAAWAADGVPVGASKASLAGYRNGLDRRPSDGPLELVVAATGDDAAERERLAAVYGSRSDLPFDVTVHRGPTADDLAALLASDADLLHFVGHASPDGLTCADGPLDAAALDAVGVGAFVLNACGSYAQGEALVEAGAVGGVVTLDDVADANAVRMGCTVARLLHAGFGLGDALSVVREHRRVAESYLVVGDGTAGVVQPDSNQPNLVRLRAVEDGFEVVVEVYPARGFGVGSVFRPHVDGVSRYAIGTGRLPPVVASRSAVREFLALEDVPVVVDGALRWSSDLLDDGLPEGPATEEAGEATGDDGVQATEGD